MEIQSAVFEKARKPIEYVDYVDVRFADLDCYGHVNSKHYLDFVSTSRISFMQREMNTNLGDIAARGFGFYVAKSTIVYKRPIIGIQRVLVSSHVEEIRDGKTLVVPFTIMSADHNTIFSTGEIEFASVDLKKNRSAGIPDWVNDLLFR